MAINYPVLPWISVPFGGNIASITCDSSISSNTTVNLAGTSPQGNEVNATHAVIDNTGINAVAYVDYGFFRYSIAPYTRKTFPIPKDQRSITFIVNSGVLGVTLTDFDPGFPDEVNQVATSAGSGGSITTYSTLDPTNKGTNLVLSMANLLATTGASASDWESVRGTISKAAGLFYCEFTQTQNVYSQVGFCVAASNMNSLFSQTTGVALMNVGGSNLYINGVSYAGYPTYIIGDIIRAAVNITTSRLWYAVNSGNWNNDASADPGAGINGINIASVVGALYPAVAVKGGGAVNVNFGQSTFAFTAPTGFGKWGV